MNAAAKEAGESKLRLSILIADDERDTVDTLGAILADEGHVVHKVIDPTRVLELVQRYRPRVCILDIEMPGQSGYTLGREIVQRYRDRRPWLIAISGKWTTQNDQLLALSIGFDHFLKKPADPAQLVELLAQLPSEPPTT